MYGTNGESLTLTGLSSAVLLANQPIGDLLDSAINESNIPNQPIGITEMEIGIIDFPNVF